MFHGNSLKIHNSGNARFHLSTIPQYLKTGKPQSRVSGIPDMVKENVSDDTAVMLMVENPSMIKRPVLEHGDELVVGFKAADYEAAGLAARNS